MYCTLDEAFNDVNPREKKPQQFKNCAEPSCWYPDKPAKIEQPVVRMGAQVQQMSPTMPPCTAMLHHCLSCDTCQRILWLHHQNAAMMPTHERKRRRRRARVGSSSTILDESLTLGNALTYLAIGALLFFVFDALSSRRRNKQ